MRATALAHQMQALAASCRTAEAPRTDADREVLRTAVGTVTAEVRHVAVELLGECWEPEHGHDQCPRCGAQLKKTPGRHTPPGRGCSLALPIALAGALRRLVRRSR